MWRTERFWRKVLLKTTFLLFKVFLFRIITLFFCSHKLQIHLLTVACLLVVVVVAVVVVTVLPCIYVETSVHSTQVSRVCQGALQCASLLTTLFVTFSSLISGGKTTLQYHMLHTHTHKYVVGFLGPPLLCCRAEELFCSSFYVFGCLIADLNMATSITRLCCI